MVVKKDMANHKSWLKWKTAVIQKKVVVAEVEQLFKVSLLKQVKILDIDPGLDSKIL